MRLSVFLFFLLAANFLVAATSDIPKKIDAKSHYVFYLHGRIVEEQGIRPRHPQYGYYEYEQILQTLERRGFTVISEARPKGTEMSGYALRVVKQIQALVASGVPPSNVCVIGASKGGGIAMLASEALKNRNVRFVLLGSCNDSGEKSFHPNLSGEVLSVFEESDEIGRSCKNTFARSTGLSKTDEIQLHLGIAHGFLYRPIQEWVEPAVQWCQRAN